MFDLAHIRCIAGNGGNGRVSFRREKYITKGGPDGGNGGHGGSIILRATKGYNTLQHFSGVKEYVAEHGEPGSKQNQEGRADEDLIIDVPVGTRVWLTAENTASRLRRTHQGYEGNLEASVKHRQFELTVKGGRVTPLPEDAIKPLQYFEQEKSVEEDELDQQVSRSESLKNVRFQDIEKVLLIEMTEEGQTYLIARGGDGGRGNDSFKSSVNTTPVQAEYGTPGERKLILFELRLIADVGLVGYPNAGKSTLLSIVTRANPKIANYPFTTLEPNLGVMYSEEAGGRDIVLADIPGLIEGASQGKGLGYEFLRHIQACRALVFILSLDETMIFQSNESAEQKAEMLWQQYTVLSTELAEYDKDLLQKPKLVSVSKIDLYDDELIAAIKQVFKHHDTNILLFSAVTKTGISQLQRSIAQHLS